MTKLLTVDEALALIAAEAQPLPAREVALRDALGLVLAIDVRSDLDSPPHDKSMMDGYAVVSGDRTIERRVLEEVVAGTMPSLTVVPGTATRIMTGAPLPSGADAVVPVEEVDLLENGYVAFATSDCQPGQHIMRRGESVRAGQVVVKCGSTIRALEVGICAEAGCSRIRAIPQPRIAVLPTGNELVPVEAMPPAGNIRNSNGPMLAATVREVGLQSDEMSVVGDDRQSLSAAIAMALAADVVLLSGGVSAGTMDLIPSVLESLGVQKVLHKVAIKPGKPIWFGVKTHGDGRRSLVFGLPGNPLSCFVCFQVFVRPALASLAGREFVGLPLLPVRLAREIHHIGNRETFAPLVNTGDGFELLPWRGSADLAAWVSACGLLRLPAKNIRLHAGQIVEILPLTRDLPGNSTQNS